MFSYTVKGRKYEEIYIKRRLSKRGVKTSDNYLIGKMSKTIAKAVVCTIGSIKRNI